jgi:biotin synthase
MSLAQAVSFSNACLGQVRHDWTRQEYRALFQLPFPELIHRGASVRRQHFDPTEVQISTLLSIKTGGCPEDCAYCPQRRYMTPP